MLHQPRSPCRTVRALLVLALPAALLSGACNGLAERPILHPPPHHPGFPAEAQVGNVWAQARYVENHAALLGDDLAADAHVLPVALQVGLRGADTQMTHLSAEELDPVLYLQDGTALAPVPYEEVRPSRSRARARIAERALKPSLVLPWEESAPGFLFFRIDPDRVRVMGHLALVLGPHVHHELDLSDSVLAFTVSTDAGPRRVRLGLGLDRWSER